MDETRPRAPGRSESGSGGSGGSGPVRRPYERPRILHREPLEVMASVCAPSPPAKGNPGVCSQGPISS